MATGTVTCSHIFQSSLELGVGQFLIRDTTFADALGSNQNMLKNVNGGRQALLHNFPNNLDTVIPPGLADIKKVELYSKIRHFVPEKYWPSLCPHPGDDVLKKISSTKSEKRKEKKIAANNVTFHSKQAQGSSSIVAFS